MQSVSIITKVVSSNLAHGEVYSIQLYVIKFVSDLRQVGGFFPGTLVSSPTKTDRHGVTEILLKVALNIIILSILLYPIYRLDFKLSVKPVPILFISIPNNSEMYLKQSFVI